MSVGKRKPLMFALQVIQLVTSTVQVHHCFDGALFDLRNIIHLWECLFCFPVLEQRCRCASGHCRRWWNNVTQRGSVFSFVDHNESTCVQTGIFLEVEFFTLWVFRVNWFRVLGLPKDSGNLGRPTEHHSHHPRFAEPEPRKIVIWWNVCPLH